MYIEVDGDQRYVIQIIKIAEENLAANQSAETEE
jgi:hypothetical protein